MTGLQGQPVLKDSNYQLLVQHRIHFRTRTHSLLHIRHALSHGVVSLGRCDGRRKPRPMDISRRVGRLKCIVTYFIWN